MKSSDRSAALEKIAFAERLKTAIVNHDEKLLSPTVLAREYNRRSKHSSIALTGVHKWLTGESIPQQEKMKVLANWLGVSVQWLRYGESGGESVPSERVQRRQRRLLSNFAALTERDQTLVEKLVEEMLRQKV